MFAAIYEDLVHNEASQQLLTLHRILEVPTTGGSSMELIRDVMHVHMMAYITSQLSISPTKEGIDTLKADINYVYPGWEGTAMWVDDMIASVHHSERHLRNPFTASKRGDFASSLHMIEELTQRFGVYQDHECRELSDRLSAIEYAPGTGRVHLSDFWGPGTMDWPFMESTDYLRFLGALDESDPTNPTVVIPNYITGHSNCIAGSSFYAVCCRNVCNDLVAHLESSIADSHARPETLAELVSQLPSATVNAPRNLSADLLGRLSDIASRHGGKVPIHGRLFSQWMHHAYPTDCPYPHQAGASMPQLPDQWMNQTGVDAVASTEDMEHANRTAHNRRNSEPKVMPLPWTQVEELLYVPAQSSTRPLARLVAYCAMVFASGLSLATAWKKARQASGGCLDTYEKIKV